MLTAGLARARALALTLLITLPAPAALAQVVEAAPLDDLIAAATAGGPLAQRILGQRYHDGDGVLQNFATAAQWFGRAAEAGDAEAQNRLGRYYHSGLGYEHDPDRARHWLEAAAAQGDPDHIFDLAAVLEPSDPEQAAALYAQAADAGHMDAAVSLGVLFQNGNGVTQDTARALQLYEAPAAVGHPRAQNNLGLLYVRGTGAPQDYDRAAKLFAAAADQGLGTAMTNLGVMYENGFGVPQSDEEAARLYRMAGELERTEADAAQAFVYDARLQPLDPGMLSGVARMARTGDPVAQFQLGWALVSAEAPQPPHWAQAARLFQAAADRGHAPSMTNLGLLYVRGLGVPQDYVLGQMWLVLAATAGLPDATLSSSALRRKMTPEQINEAQSRATQAWQKAQEDAIVFDIR